MKVILFLIVLILSGLGSYFLVFQNYKNIPISTLMSSETRELAKLSQGFMESIQFKDFKTAAGYSLPEHREKMDIPSLIERMFKVKHEVLDIKKIEILETELDSTQKRAKVNVQTDVKILNTDEKKNPNIILYWKKLPDNKWYMDLATSLDK